MAAPDLLCKLQISDNGCIWLDGSKRCVACKVVAFTNAACAGADFLIAMGFAAGGNVLNNGSNHKITFVLHSSSLLWEAIMLVLNIIHTLNVKATREVKQDGSNSFASNATFLVLSFLLTICSFAANLLGALWPTPIMVAKPSWCCACSSYTLCSPKRQLLVQSWTFVQVSNGSHRLLGARSPG
jgi:hypothetical protein